MCPVLGIMARVVQKTEHDQLLPEAWEGEEKAPGSCSSSTGGGGVCLAGTSRMQDKVDMLWASADLAVRPPHYTWHGHSHVLRVIVFYCDTGPRRDMCACLLQFLACPRR